MDYYSSLDSRSLDSTPTIFEILSANELENLLTPSVRYLIVHYSTKYPKWLLKVALSFDELNLVFRSMLEYRFLKNWNSTFTEKFYGLKRTSMNNFLVNDLDNKISDMIQAKKRLNKWQIFSILFVNIGLKIYLKEKLDILYEKNLPLVLTKKLTTKSWKYWFVKLYPLITSFFKLVDVIYQILYLSGRTKSPTFVDALLKVEYARLNQFDYDLNEPTPTQTIDPLVLSNVTKRPPTFGQHLTSSLSRYYSPVKTIMSKLSTTIFPSAIFLLKFLEWWNSSEFASKLVKKQQNLIDKEIPPPKVTSSKPKHQNSSNCPICKTPITNPAIIETGYVFCYPCIYNNLTDGSEEKGGRCPITGVKLLGCRYLHESHSWKVDGVRKLMI